jgi:sigma-B regulation protein RsbU (phosphoserine phosphatase)
MPHKKSKLDSKAKYELLIEISNKIRHTLDLDEILNHLLDTLHSVISYDAAGIFVLSSDVTHPGYYFPSQTISGLAFRGFEQRPINDDQMLMAGKGIIGQVIKSGEVILLNDVRKDPRYIEGRIKTLSEVTIPVFNNNRVIGALDVESDKLNAFDLEDVELLNFFADAASISIEKVMLHLQIIQSNRITEQLEIAGKVQSQLLPGASPKIDGFDIAGICIPTYAIGGDYFDYIKIDDNNLAIVIADVSGDGIPAALIMTSFRTLLRAHSKNYIDPSHLMEILNKQVSEFTRKRDFITVFYGILNTKRNSFSYTNCGHNLPLLFKHNGEIQKLETGGPSLNILDNAKFESNEIILQSRDQIILYTDGVTEIFNKKNIQFGEERLIETITKSKDLDADSLIKVIVNRTKEFCKSEFYNDDYTIVIVKKK